MQAARLALSGIDIPVLGVCLGHQALALADGKNVVRSKKGPVHGQPVKVEHDGSGIFAGQESPMTLTRYNSLIVEGKRGILRESAWSDKEVMGLTHPNFEVHGIQIHPESVGSELGYSILDSFLSKTMLNNQFMLARNRGETCHFAEYVMELSAENNSSMALVLALKSVLDVELESGMVTKEEAASLYGEDLSAARLSTVSRRWGPLITISIGWILWIAFLAGNPPWSLYVLGLLGLGTLLTSGNDSIWT